MISRKLIGLLKNTCGFFKKMYFISVNYTCVCSCGSMYTRMQVPSEAGEISVPGATVRDGHELTSIGSGTSTQVLC